MTTFYYPEISKKIVASAYKIHTALGPGLLESTYEAVLEYELKKSGLFVERQKKLPLIYETVELEDAYRLDFVRSFSEGGVSSIEFGVNYTDRSKEKSSDEF